MRTSYSALETFKQCPQKYKFQEIDKIKVPKSREAVFGTIIHASLKYMFSRDPLYPALDEIIAYWRNSWNNAQEKLELSTEEQELYSKQGESILKRFWAKNQPWNFNVVDLESRFEIVVEDPKTKEAHILVGIMDRIDKPSDDNFEIIDYKTARKMKSQEAVDEDIQLSLYHFGLKSRWPHLDPASIKLSLYYLKHNEKLTTSRNTASIEYIKNTILDTIHEIEERVHANEFPPHPSPLCDWCGYKTMCPAWKFLYETKIEEKKNIKEIIHNYFELKKVDQENSKKISELQTEIKSYMEEHNLTRLFGEDGIIAKKLQERFAYNFERIKDVLQQEDRLDIWESIFAPDEKKLKKLLKEIPLPLRKKIEEAKELTKSFEVLTTSKKTLEDLETDTKV